LPVIGLFVAQNLDLMKFQLKHLSAYLPYELMCKVEGYSKPLPMISAYDDHQNEFKLILHPISDLKNKIEFEGKIIIPIIELAKQFHKSEWIVTEYKAISEYRVMCFVENSKSRYMYFDIYPEIEKNSYEIVKKIQSMKIDYDDLIGKENAVDINSL